VKLCEISSKRFDKRIEHESGIESLVSRRDDLCVGGRSTNVTLGSLGAALPSRPCGKTARQRDASM
jgi:hypothetical protein